MEQWSNFEPGRTWLGSPGVFQTNLGLFRCKGWSEFSRRWDPGGDCWWPTWRGEGPPAYDGLATGLNVVTPDQGVRQKDSTECRLPAFLRMGRHRAPAYLQRCRTKAPCGWSGLGTNGLKGNLLRNRHTSPPFVARVCLRQEHRWSSRSNRHSRNKPNLPYGGYFVPSPFGEGLYNPGARAFAGK
jgi:hypothetical protein